MCQVTTSSTSKLDPWGSKGNSEDQEEDTDIKPIIVFREISNRRLNWQNISTVPLYNIIRLCGIHFMPEMAFYTRNGVR